MKSRSSFWIVVWLLFFFPIGFYFLWTNKNWSRNVKIGITAGWIILFGLAGLTTKSSSTSNAIEAVKPTPETIKNNSPKPTTDPCAQYLGTAQMVDCIKTQEALQKGTATNYPLKAKVTFDNSALYITNLDPQEWDQCTAILNETDPQGDNFQSDGFVITPGQTEAVGWGNFANAENQRFNYSQIKPKTIDLDCVVGGKTDSKTGAFKGGTDHRSLFNL